MSVEFRILGPLEIVDGDRLVEIRSPGSACCTFPARRPIGGHR
jgi:hypothetical protein